jgi:hypothetical protein
VALRPTLSDGLPLSSVRLRAAMNKHQTFVVLVFMTPPFVLFNCFIYCRLSAGETETLESG